MQLRIDTDLMFDGSAELVKDATVVIEGSKIVYAGEQEHAPKADRTIQTAFIMPGMWECHGHFLGTYTADFNVTALIDPRIAVLRCVSDAKRALQQGITSVREVGGYGLYLKKVIKEGLLQGPSIYGAGSILSMTGGHADYHDLPLEFIGLIASKGNEIVAHADGIGECMKAVRKQLRKGADIIKYCASGGVLSIVDHPIHQQWSLAEQKAIVEEATRADRAVAAHCHGAPGIKAALEAGVKTIEHGSFLDEDLADLMLEKNAIIVPTFWIIEKIYHASTASGAPEESLVKMEIVRERHQEAIKIAYKKGVTIAMGTDIFMSGESALVKWGDNANELGIYVDLLGMSPIEALQTATKNAPATLGKQAPKSGLLQKDYDADLLLLNKNPIDDISILLDRKNIANVIKSGILQNTSV